LFGGQDKKMLIYDRLMFILFISRLWLKFFKNQQDIIRK
jgi:hypothetical protein